MMLGTNALYVATPYKVILKQSIESIQSIVNINCCYCVVMYVLLCNIEGNDVKH